MLGHLYIENLAVVESLHLVFEQGMTVLSGETGAGKSILIGALGLTLGDRADATLIRPPATSASVTAIFDLSHNLAVLQWLRKHELHADEECILRRIIHQDGRSRAYINGRAVPLVQLKSLGSQLLDIHGQHQHQSLLKPEYQRYLLDEYAGHPELLENLRKEYLEWFKIYKELKELSSSRIQSDKLSLLNYQIAELETLDLKPNEVTELETEHRQLAHTEHLLTSCQAIMSGLEGDDEQDLSRNVHTLIQQLHSLLSLAPSLKNVEEMLKDAAVLLKEAHSEVQNFVSSLSNDPERLNSIDKRLNDIHTLARKHRVSTENLAGHFEALQKEADSLKYRQSRVTQLEEALRGAIANYQIAAEKLSESRKKAALDLSTRIQNNMQTLEMQHGKFEVAFSLKEGSTLHSTGLEEVEFLVSTNPGLPLQPLRKIASGGELSRISLIIQVITAQKVTTPTLIFDEVDVGISGKTADIVGQLMRQVANNAQVFCITHLPQVAAYGHQHYKVSKRQTDTSTATYIIALNKAQRVQEVARMLGGVKITAQTLAHAEEMLEELQV